MSPDLPPLLADLITAHNAHDPSAFVACFADDAVVRDEGRLIFGRPAIQAWFEEACQKYHATIQVTALATRDGEPVLDGRVTGNFEGSPVDLHYYLGLDDGKIVALKIAA